MTRWRRAWDAFWHQAPPPAAPATASGSGAMREAAGKTVEDEDEEGWRRLTGDSERDLSPLTQERMQKIALYLWEANPLANRIIELPLAYLLAEGVRLTVPDAEAQGWLDAFWKDPINRLDLKLVKKVRELALYGEQCWPAFVNEISGHVRLGYLDPARIATVVVDPDNAEQPIGIVTKRDAKGNSLRYRVIVNGPETIFAARAQAIRAGFADGECFFFRVNDLSNGRRGRSDLLATTDWLDAYDQYLFGELDRHKAMRAFLWDVTLTGATPEEVEARAKKIAAPRPGSVRVHNDAETWEAESPQLHAQDGAEGARLFRNHILGGASIAEHWYGGGGDVNRAAASEMGEPTFKVMSMRQSLIKAIVEDLGTYQLRQRFIAAVGQDLDLEKPDPDFVCSAEFPELVARDVGKYTQALQQVVIASGMAVEQGRLTAETALKLIAIVAERLGVEIDPEAELAAAQAQAAERRAEETINDLPGDPDPENHPPSPAGLRRASQDTKTRS